MISDTKVVAIGGGTGLSTMLKGLKLHTHNITAVVTVADDGGSSGILRSDLGMLAPGDVRNCVSALAEVDPVMGELLNFRFKDGSLKVTVSAIFFWRHLMKPRQALMRR